MNLTKKKISFFFFVLILFFFLLIYFLNIFAKIFLIKQYGTIYSPETLKIYKKYYGTVNHLRNPWVFDYKNLIFTKIGNGKKSIIFQGDSWSEYLTKITRRKTLETFAEKNNFKLFLSGTSSYSPSIYNSQLELLISKFNIEPKIIVTFFDHTDIGDELCRYKNYLIKKDERFIVLPYKNSDINYLFNLENTFKRLEILNSNNVDLIILIRLSFLKLKEKFGKTKKITCNANKIIEYLKKGISKDERNYVVNIIRRYLVNILKIQELEKFILVTHPHRQHIKNNYILKIDDLINEALSQISYDERINILNFENYAGNFIDKYENLNYMFAEGDILSHLNSDYYDNQYLEKILDEVKKNNF